MRMTLIAVFVFLLGSTGVKSEDKKVFRVQLFSTTGVSVQNPIVFNVSMGSPPQNFSLFPFTMTTELIVVDKNCGTPLSRCLRFCQSPEYQFYCDLSCNTNRLNWPVVCGVSASASYYDPKISSTFRSLDDEKHGRWKAQFQDRRRMIGKFGIEDLVIQTKDNEAAIKVDFEFVHAFSMDIRLFQVDDSNAVFGIAPGRRSTILRLFEANIIAKPLLSISLLKTEMVFGDLDRKNCENDWEFHSTVKDDRWTIAVDSIYISHVGTFGKGLAHLQTHWPVIGVPTKVIEKLIEEKVITVSLLDTYFFADCEVFNLTIKISIDGKVYTLTKEHLSALYFESTCYILLQRVPPVRYSNEEVWILGHPFVGHAYCVAFDFQKNRIGIVSYLDNV